MNPNNTSDTDSEEKKTNNTKMDGIHKVGGIFEQKKVKEKK